MKGKIFNGIVVKGLQNGRKFGFPTANIQLNDGGDIENGVYAVRIDINGEKHIGMMYSGTRPTLGLSAKSIEIHIFDFTNDIYGEKISFSIEKKIFTEQKFENAEELKKNISQYKKEILKYFLCEK
ncbi:MAG: riboflavin kinase [Bacteroidales bacterium]|nr:riboflavin kinase [Bacteroidales bacterium]